MAARKLSPLQRAVAVAVVTRGEGTVTEVANEYGVTPQAIRLCMPGLISATRPQRFSQELQEAVRVDLLAGLPYGKIQERHELTLNNLTYLRRKLGIPARKRTPPKPRKRRNCPKGMYAFGNY